MQEYFPVSHVVPAVLDIYQSLLGVRLEEIKDGETWHSDAQVYSVWDSAHDNAFLGYAYLDLYSRRSSLFLVLTAGAMCLRRFSG